MANIDGDNTANVLNGTANADLIRGFQGDDVLFGHEGDDELRGGAGDDYLDGGDGADILKGWTGKDTVSYVESFAAVQIYLDLGYGSGGYAEGDTYDQIENVIGSYFADRIYGNSSNNEMYGRDGNDSLYDNSGGSDDLYGEAGNDYLSLYRSYSSGDPAETLLMDGGTGDDKLAFSWHSAADFTIDLFGGDGNDVITIQNSNTYNLPMAGKLATIDAGADDDVVALHMTFTADVTLGTGSDLVLLNSELFLTHDLYGDFGSVVIQDFDTSASGDRIYLDQFLWKYAVDWDGATNPFDDGYLVIGSSGANTNIYLDANADGLDLLPILQLVGVNAASLTADHFFGLDPAGGAITGRTADANSDDLLLFGTARDDVFEGSDGNDVFYSRLSGNDIGYGYGGSDRFYINRSKTYSDFMFDGGDGNDIFDFEFTPVISASGDPNFSGLLIGGAGDDTFNIRHNQSLPGSETSLLRIDPGTGDNRIVAGHSSRVEIDFSQGDNTLDFYTNGIWALRFDAVDNFYDITLNGFQVGGLLDEDDILVGNLLNDMASGWDHADNPFDTAQGYLKLVQNGANAELWVDGDGGGDGFERLVIFTNTFLLDFTIDDFLDSEDNPTGYDFSAFANQVLGGLSADILDNTLATDWLTGDAGTDEYRMTAGENDQDIILDYEAGELIVTTYDSFIGRANFTMSGDAEVRYQQINGNTYFFGDTDGDGITDETFIVAGAWIFSGDAANITGIEGEIVTPRDFDFNGLTDLLFQEAGSGAFLRLNDPFFLGAPTDEARDGYTPIGVADLDGDGIWDNVIRRPNQHYQVQYGAENDGSTFASGTTFDILGFADFDGDGADEAFAISARAGQSNFLIVDDALTTTQNILLSGYDLVGFGDYDGDGADEALMRGPNNVHHYYDAATGGTVFVGNRGMSAVVMGDFNGDGFDDVLARRDNGDHYQLLLGGASGALTTPTGLGRSAFDPIATGDFDGDGTLDMLVHNANLGYKVWTDDLATENHIGIGGAGFAGIGDFNGDGIDDVLLTRPTANNEGRILYSGSRTGEQFVSAMQNQTVMDIADYDGDGADDILVKDDVTGAYSILPGGTGTAIALDASLDGADVIGAQGLNTLNITSHELLNPGPEAAGGGFATALSEDANLSVAEVSEEKERPAYLTDEDLASEDVTLARLINPEWTESNEQASEISVDTAHDFALHEPLITFVNDEAVIHQDDVTEPRSGGRPSLGSVLSLCERIACTACDTLETPENRLAVRLVQRDEPFFPQIAAFTDRGFPIGRLDKRRERDPGLQMFALHIQIERTRDRIV
jgi:Ca2+-binding RTX toxin-like protein